ncbi:hypothetical protein GLOIN_2v1773371 [Rhizophagus irregularis DAOM 181602=DAOM 197198]|uniref:Uncharacterized protein n=1 Tax=Rhizophagus irregularis (strain DAOM 181602 / DAOM 197198 / MUCL 43194) TaxID=747089 RepID=A0A2P4Q504_RHIID|nr:hypothetical protein GLOIN_2v1773371 [Rhizophagus irregularis DAOM 181602=DAOM 197198]POG72731.1 hypothetical protein GLOIN_2v1773371 [Rhizophagus irregularis DAOM 181602=DAOM 197198]|eukprot:XP_025179597.1 hypothetical protein GLOIN_2v1773371 [Rhizophagus irregularis DAOM 181602=DAOM 197198]
MSGLLLNPVAFKVMIEEADPRLIGFFDIAIIPNTHSTGSNNESTDAMHKNWSSNDFHSIKEKRRSNATWLSTGHHMTTCICKQITSCPQIPITYNGASIYNPTNIDVYNINNHISQNGSNELTEEEQDNEEQDNEEQEEGIEEMNDSDLTTISFN